MTDKAKAYITYLQDRIDRHNRRSDDIIMYQDYDVWEPAMDDVDAFVSKMNPQRPERVELDKDEPDMDKVNAMLTDMSEPLDLPKSEPATLVNTQTLTDDQGRCVGVIATDEPQSVTWVCTRGLIHDIGNRLIIDEVPFDVETALFKLGTAPYRITITKIED